MSIAQVLTNPHQVGQFSVENTRVILSFGGASGGFEFAMELRRNIMQKYNLPFNGNPAFVYLDAESLKVDPGTRYTWDEKLGIFKMSNPFWKAFYQGAMGNSKTRVFLLTGQWLRSQWCWDELDWYMERLRGGLGIKPVWVIFPDAKAMLQQPTITTRDGRTRRPRRFYESMLLVDGAFKVYINTVVSSDLRRVMASTGHSYTFSYTCNQVELNLILNAVVTG